tara:strand:- start:56 stop:514 length:459 start_codon:yes stop_codon:yes gene_type:complete
MEGIEEQKIMLYSPRQMETATFFGGPLCGIYMLSANYKRLEKPHYALNVILIGSIILILFMLGAFHPLSQKIPQAVYQAIPVLILWGICKKYHISKEDIIEEQRYTFRSNWTVFFVLIIGLILVLILITLLGFFIYGVLGVPITLDLSHLPE